jgi:predicted GNAT family acetyltransferase
MKVQLIESTESFLERSTQCRSDDPLRTNVIGSVAQSVLSGRRRYDRCRWWVVDDDDTVVAVAMRTSPQAMVIAPMSRDAAMMLGREVGHLDDELPGLSGPREAVEHFMEGYRASGSPGSRRADRVARRELLYEVTTLKPPNVEGVGRLARHDDVELLATMFVRFVDEVVLSPVSLVDAREGIASSVDEGSLYCWEHHGALVSFAGHAPVVRAGETLVGRVGPVYTPPDRRGHGYASAATAMVTRKLLDRGARVMLFTDAANPTSNAIYRALGYQPIDELVDVGFEKS